jgi:hypothetical protein
MRLALHTAPFWLVHVVRAAIPHSLPLLISRRLESA